MDGCWRNVLVLLMRENNKCYYSSNIDCKKMLLVCVNKKDKNTINKKDKKSLFIARKSNVTIMQWTKFIFGFFYYCFSKLLPLFDVCKLWLVC